jgi:hypothetical protein
MLWKKCSFPIFLIYVYAFITPCRSFSQDFQWWTDNVKWDGFTHWRNYIIYSPAMLGPNALPIPTLMEGKTDTTLTFGSSARCLYATGDFTYAQSFYLTYPTNNKNISFDISWIPREIYQTSHEWKTKRKVHFPAYYDRHAMTDILFNTVFQLSKEEVKWMDLTFRSSFRFATSTHVNAARGTDAPGYSFDLTAGKSMSSRLRFMGMLGFYVWQTNRDDYLQNDAFLLGLGVKYFWKKWSISTQYRGYWGYIGDGDDNVAISLKIKYTGQSWHFFTLVSKGMEDNFYNSLECGVIHLFKNKF